MIAPAIPNKNGPVYTQETPESLCSLLDREWSAHFHDLDGAVLTDYQRKRR